MDIEEKIKQFVEESIEGEPLTTDLVKWGIRQFWEENYEIPPHIAVKIYNEFLVRLHTARWTGNTKEFNELIDKIAAYSYVRTNSNFGESDGELNIKLNKTLLNLV